LTPIHLATVTDTPVPTLSPKQTYTPSPTVELRSSWVVVIGEDKNVWLKDTMTLRQQQVTTDASDSIGYSSLRWSPSGDTLAFIRTEQQEIKNVNRIVLLDIGTFTQSTIVDNMLGGFDWSPDGTRIAYGKTNFVETVESDGNILYEVYDALWAVELNNKQTYVLVSPKSFDDSYIYPHWSSSGSHILLNDAGTYSDLSHQDYIAHWLVALETQTISDLYLYYS
jgi:dipeptidyl aminopeptidase/acylaminoacyl peptidase